MSEENVYANHNFILNGDFKNNLNDWTINDESKVTRQEGLWQGQTIGFMNAVNMGEGDQTITLASLPSPEPGRAEYKLVFWYEAVRGAVGTLRIKPSMTGEEDLTLVPSREAEPEQALNPDELLLDLNLAEYTHSLTLNSAETSVKFTVISPDMCGQTPAMSVTPACSSNVHRRAPRNPPKCARGGFKGGAPKRMGSSRK